MHTVRSRVILLATIFFLLFLLLYFYQEEKSSLVLAIKDDETQALFKSSLEFLDRQTGYMKQSALTLAAGAGAIYELRTKTDPEFDRRIIHDYVLDSMRALPAALGGGIWFEPRTFLPARHYFGPYAYWEANQLVYTEEYDTPEYDYHRRAWYTVAVPVEWDRGLKRPQSAYWTEPYADKVGSERIMITVTVPVYSAAGRIIGTTTTDWGLSGMARIVDSLPKSRGAELLLVHAPSGRVLLATFKGTNAIAVLADWKSHPLASVLSPPAAGQTRSEGGVRYAGCSWHVYHGASSDGFLFMLFVPERSQMADLRAVNAAGRIILVAIFVVLFTTVFVLVRRFTRDLDRLVGSLDMFTLTDDSPPEISDGFRYEDLRKIASAFDRMASRIGNLSHERIALERSVLQMKKMEALGRMAGGVAHDFRNLLQIIYSLTDSLKASLADSPEELEILRQLHAASDRAGKLISDLLAYSRQREIARRPASINATIETIRPLLERLGGDSCRIVSRLSDGLPDVLIDPMQIEQIMMNLFVNAHDAMPGGGQVLVVSSLVRRPPRDAGGADRDWVEVVFADEGSGIPEDVLPHVFEPFFTTKPEGHGTGLGLSIVFGIMQQHDGWIEVENIPGEGAVFKMYFPVPDRTTELT